MVTGQRKIVPIREGLWTTPGPGEQPQLVGSRCPACGEVVFPKKKMCPNCQNKNVQEIKLGRRGKIFSLTQVMQRPPVYYQGPVPYSLGYVELPEGVRVETLFIADNLDSLKIGMEVELVIEKLYEKEDKDVYAFKFKPVKD